jgi:hypothetical protein
LLKDKFMRLAINLNERLLGKLGEYSTTGIRSLTALSNSGSRGTAPKYSSLCFRKQVDVLAN